MGSRQPVHPYAQDQREQADPGAEFHSISQRAPSTVELRKRLVLQLIRSSRVEALCRRVVLYV